MAAIPVGPGVCGADGGAEDADALAAVAAAARFFAMICDISRLKCSRSDTALAAAVNLAVDPKSGGTIAQPEASDSREIIALFVCTASYVEYANFENYFGATFFRHEESFIIATVSL